MFSKSRALAGLIPDFSAQGISSKSYWCRIASHERQFNLFEQKHSFFELHYCLAGSGGIIVGDKPYELKSGEFVLVRAYENHRLTEQSEDFVKFVWGFNIDDGVGKYVNLLSSSSGKYKASDLMLRLLEIINLGLEEIKNNRLFVLNCALATLFFEMCAVISANKTELCNAQVSYKDKTERLVKQIETYIRDNIGKPMRASDIASEFSFSERQLSRIFMRYIGKTVAEYLRDERFALAEHLLESSEMPLDEIALRIGYNDAFSFGKAFKKHTGISPGAFRKTLSKK